MHPFDLSRTGELIWFHDRGFGYVHPSERMVYGDDYDGEYMHRSMNNISDALMTARAEFVNNHTNGTLVDIGAASGAFVKTRNRTGNTTYGYDIMPSAVYRLVGRQEFWNPYERTVAAATFWDSLEHFEDPSEILKKVEEWAFISIPIFKDCEHARTSKHYKPGEHIWLFTEQGLIRYMKDEGFELIEKSRFEEEIGREDIGSYAFRRIQQD